MAVFFLTQCFTKTLLQKNKGGNVLFISSETGETADIRPYGFTKAAMNSMIQGLASLFCFKRNSCKCCCSRHYSIGYDGTKS